MYRCKACQYSFIGKVRAIRLSLEGLGFRAIERLLGVSDTTVPLWVKHLGKTIQEWEPLPPTKVELLALDEIHARFRRRTKCYSKSVEMIRASLPIFFRKEWQYVSILTNTREQANLTISNNYPIS